MRPVVASDGNTFERGAIKSWLRTNNTSPMSREKISARLYRNRIIHQQASEFLQSHPEMTPPIRVVRREEVVLYICAYNLSF